MSPRSKFLSAPLRAVASLTGLVLVGGLALAAPAAADQNPTVTINDVTVTESDSGTTTAVFTIRLTQSSKNRTTVTYGTDNGTAKAPGDYAATSGQLVFAPGVTTKTVSVDVVGDTTYEGDEYFYLYVGSPNALVPDNQGQATILDDDPRPYVSVGNTTVVEGNTGTATANFPVTLDRASANDVRVRYETSNGSAAAGADYAYTHGTLTIPAGQTSATIAVPVNGDILDEGISEYFYLALSAPVGALVFGGTAYAIVVDDDATPYLSVVDSAVVEGNSGTKDMTFQILLSSASPNPVTVFYSTSDGTAVAPGDYTAQRGVVTFAPGEVSKTVAVPVVGDTTNEGNAEYFSLRADDVAGAQVADSFGYGEIVDNDPTAKNVSFLTVDTAVVTEPDTGSVNEVFTVRLQPASTSVVTVNYATSGSSADPGSDFTPTNGTLTIPKNATSATIKVPVLGDDVQENDEQFSLNLSGAVNAAIDDGSAAGIIANDDTAPLASISDVTVTEGDDGTTGDAALEISLSAPTAVTSSVVYTTNNNEAVAPSDFTTVSATAVFQPGETSKIVHVPIIGDNVDENDEQFYVYLSGANNLGITDNWGWVKILDDDRYPTMSIDDPSVYEGTTGTTTGVFTVTLSAPSVNPITVNYGTSNGSAVTPDDYLPSTGTLTFAPGQTTATIAVTVQSDTIDENTEYLSVNLGGATNAYLADAQGYLEILDDDTLPALSIGEGSLVEPDSGTAAMSFTVTLETPSLNTVTVPYGTSDGTAVAPGDYQAVNGTLTFAPGDTSETFTVPVVGDTIHENYEYFNIGLGTPTNAYRQDSYSYGGIFDNDALPNLAIDESGVVEGNAGSKNGTFTVTLQPASPNTVTVNYGTSDGTATAGDADYTPTSGTLTFAPGQTSKTVTVPVLGDTKDENNEYFAMSLSSAVNASVLDGTGYVTIFDNDPSGSGSIISVNDATVVEGNSGTTNAVFSITVSPAPTAPVTVNYRTTNNNATAGEDYVPQTGTLTFAAGQTSKTVSVPVKGDTVNEGDESFNLTLFSLGGPASYGEGSAYGVILGDDRSPLISIGDVTVAEGGPGSTVDAGFTVRLIQSSPQPVLVDWDTRDGDAVAPGDYAGDGGTLTFAPGQTTKTVTVTVNGDDLVEGDEKFYVDLSHAVGGNITSSESTGVAVVQDSDAFDVMGSVVKSTGGGASGAKVVLSGNNLPNRNVTTPANGSFTFSDVPDGRYTLTPSQSGKTFVPASYTVDVRGGSLTGYTFIVTSAPSISGQVVDSGGNPVPGVTVTRKGNSQADATTVTNGQGYYAITGSPAGTYTVKPTLSGATFTPASKSVTQTAANALTANFARN